MRKRPLVILFSVIVVDLIGFGVVMPILPFYASQFGANGTILGLLLTAYAAMQFCFARLWGRLSDRIGRRKVLFLTLLAGSGALVLLGLASSLKWLFIGRILSGVFAANISVASAYVSDVTTEADRTRGMGMIGAAFGVGFLLGPAIGGALAQYGYHVPILVAAALTGLNALTTWWRLPEPERHRPSETLQPVAALEQADRQVRRLVVLNFIFTAGVAILETTLAYFLRDRFSYDAHHVAFIFAMMALLMVAIQAGLIRQLVIWCGERRLLVGGSFLLAVSLALIPILHLPLLAWIALAISAVGRGISQPALMGLVSFQAAADRRGTVMGAFQASASLARVAAPVAGGMIYDRVPNAVFLASALLVGIVGILGNARSLGQAQPTADTCTPTSSDSQGSP
ncbi:MAG: MFS transporter [Deltaproteobacteria bacterium]|nr:MFS transporter [Deltaproteobacteria bacterium]